MAKKVPPVHPGEILREEFLVPLRLTPYAVAAALHVPRTRTAGIGAVNSDRSSLYSKGSMLSCQMKSPALVLTTVNAPYSKKLDAQALALCLLDPQAAKEACGPVSSFFGEVQPALQIAFARMHGITEAQLVAAAKAFSAYSGQTYPLAG